MALTGELNRVKFVSEDFDTYVQEAKEFYQTFYPEDFNNVIATDMGNALLQQSAFASQTISFAINRKASEMFFETARLNKSITKLARMLGYPIRPAYPAQTDCTITFTGAPFLVPITIPIGFQFNAGGDTVYEYRGAIPLVLNAGDTSITATLKEGKRRRLVFRSTGEPNQQFSLTGIPSTQFCYADGMILTVDGVEWLRKDLLKYESTETFEVLFTDDPPKLRFGDGISGKVPPEGAEIVISFVYGKGRAGAIGTNQITSSISTLILDGQKVEMTFVNTTSTIGGNPEDINSVKAFASAFFRTQNAAVIKEDYDTIAMLQPGVALADTQTIRGVSGDLQIIGFYSGIFIGMDIVSGACQDIEATGVSGIPQVGVSGVGSVGVSGLGALFVGGISSLGVSGINLLSTDVSGNILGLENLGVSGISALTVSGTSSVGVSGLDFVGVSGLGYLGVSGQSQIFETAVSGIELIQSNVSGLNDYLSRTLADTSKANNVQVVILSVDANNRYMAPTLGIINDTEAVLQGMADAVVTVNVVDGSPYIVQADILITIGISDTAVEQNVTQLSYDALAKSDNPPGLLIRRDAGKNLYRSDIYNAIKSANDVNDVKFINVKITGPSNQLDVDGNLLIRRQQVIQDGVITIKIIRESQFIESMKLF